MINPVKDKKGSKRGYQGSNRVHRGGSWYGNPKGVRASYRFDDGPAFRSIILGFRLVRNK